MAGQYRFKDGSGNIVAQISASVDGVIFLSGSQVNFSQANGIDLGNVQLAGTASNALLLDGFDSQAFAFTSSIHPFTASIAGTNSFTSSANARLNSIEEVSASNISRLNTLEEKTGSLATTGSNTFFGTQTFSGSVYIKENLIVQGSSSLQNITASAVDIGTNKIILNVNNPSVRYAGISVYDSGSTAGTGSLWWDSLYNHWIYEHPEDSGAPYNSAIMISGPKNSGNLGEEVGLVSNYIMKAVGDDHISASAIYDDGTKISLKSNTDITGSVRITKVQPDLVLNSTSNTQYSRLTFEENGVELSGVQYVNSSFPTTEYRRSKLELFNGNGIHFIPNGVFTSPVMAITGSSVGIGTTVPMTTLNVHIPSTSNTSTEIFRATDGVLCDFKIYLNRGTTSNGSTSILNTYAGNMAFQTNNTEVFRISGSYIGIGITNPNAPLTIASPAVGSSIGATNAQTAYDYSRFRIKHYSDSNVGLSIGYAGANLTYLQTCYNEGTTAPMLLNPFGGNIGIGTTDSTHNLEVAGQMRYLNLSGNAELKISRASTNFGSGLGLYTGATHNWLLGTAWGTTGNNFIIYNVNTSKQILRGDYSTNGISVSTDHTNLGSAALNVYTAGSGGANSGNQIWLRGGCTNITNNSNAIVLSYSDSILYSHAIKTKHNSAAINGNSIDFYVWNYGTDESSTIGTRKMMSIDGTGVLKPSQPGFSVNRGSSANQSLPSENTVLQFNNVRFDTQGNFNTSNYRFYAPVAGRYLFTCQVRYDGSANTTGYIRTYFTINGTSGNEVSFQNGHQILGPGSYSTNYTSGTISAILQLAEGDWVDVRGGHTAGTNLQGESQFSGYLLG